MMRSLPVVSLLTAGCLVALVAVAGAGAAQDHSYGPEPWNLGLEWTWGNDDGTVHDTYVDDHREMVTQSGKYDAWMTRTTIEEDGESEAYRVTAYVENTHRRVYHEATTTNEEGDPVTAVTQYSPPAPYPMWESIGPGADIHLEVEEHTSYRVGLTPAGSENTTWDWYAWADEEVYNLTTPEGTFEGFNVTVYREAKDSSDVSRFEYFYSPEARNFVATWGADETVDMELTHLQLHPPPVARASSESGTVEEGENLTLRGGASHAIEGEVTEHTWRLPAGVAVDGQVRQAETTVGAENVTVTFPEAGTYEVTLEVAASNDQTDTSTISVRVVERSDEYKLSAPDHAVAGDPVDLRLVTPEGAENVTATWAAEGLGTVEGTDPAPVFQQPGRYTVDVTYEDSRGNTGTLSHEVVVVEAGGPSASGGNTPDLAEDDPLGPTILSPENGTTVSAEQTLVVARSTGLDDPGLMLPNGLRVPLDGSGEVDSAQVPLPRSSNTIALVDGDTTVDQVTIQQDDDADVRGASNDDDMGTNEAPFPWLATLLLAPLLRRRSR
jgi:hypothetical protein